jgi:hypothetical protein
MDLDPPARRQLSLTMLPGMSAVGNSCSRTISSRFSDVTKAGSCGGSRSWKHVDTTRTQLHTINKVQIQTMDQMMELGGAVQIEPDDQFPVGGVWPNANA